MRWTTVVILILIVAAAAGGQILFKIAAQSIIESDAMIVNLLRLAFNPYLLASLAIYGLLVILWVFVLRDTPLSQAYLIFSLSLVLVPLAGTFFFEEPFAWRLVGGLLIILMGLVVALW